MDGRRSARHPLPARDPEERIKDFLEVCPGFDHETAVAEAQRCLNCKDPPCVRGCPVGVNVPRFISFLAAGDVSGAAESLYKDNLLPGICGRVCPQENQCERLCVRRERGGGSVAAGALERYVADRASETGRPERPRRGRIGKSVAVVGSGPAGLACAGDLIAAGFDVTVYEAFHRPGGVLVYGIPEFRLPDRVVSEEISALARAGVLFRTDCVIGKTISLDELRRDNAAVFLGTGAGLPVFLKIKGENLCGVYSANEYLTRVNLMKAYRPDAATPVQRGRNVAVIGAGNVAMDSARTALRMGAESVTLVYRRSRAEMPARAEEIRHAEEEGVKFLLLSSPVEILGKDGFLTGIRCVRNRLGEPDASGRRRPVPVEGSGFVLDCDQLIVALGTSPNPLLASSEPSLARTAKGTIEVNPGTGETSIENVFAGGDAVTGAATVIMAMGAGRLAARTIIGRHGKR